MSNVGDPAEIGNTVIAIPVKLNGEDYHTDHFDQVFIGHIHAKFAFDCQNRDAARDLIEYRNGFQGHHESRRRRSGKPKRMCTIRARNDPGV
jgi:hypothetical protein